MSHLLRFTLLLFLASCSAFAGLTEQTVLQELNLARTQPRIYAGIVAARGPVLRMSPKAVAEAVRYLQKRKPVGALIESPGLSQAAASHIFDTGPRGLRGHRGSDGSRVTQRADRFGRWDQLIGENLIYGRGTPRDWIIALIVDDGVSDRYHRVNMFKSEFRLVGIAAGAHARAGRMMVTDFAAKYRENGNSVAFR